MRKQYDYELGILSSDLIKMASLSESAVKSAVKALMERNADAAKDVILNDTVIDDYEKKIEQQALKIIYREQPVAGDLRNVSTALKMVTDIERIGDHGADISGIALKLMEDGEAYCTEIVSLPVMAEEAISMVNKSVRAYVNRDEAAAREVIRSDDKVDGLFEEIKNKMIKIMAKSPNFAEQVIYFMMIAKYLERIGDHAVNIAEWVIFNITGVYRNSRLF